MLKRSLEIKKNIYGEEHPDIASTLIILSSHYHDLGDILNAKKMAQDALLLLQDTHYPLSKWNASVVFLTTLEKKVLGLPLGVLDIMINV